MDLIFGSDEYLHQPSRQKEAEKKLGLDELDSEFTGIAGFIKKIASVTITQTNNTPIDNILSGREIRNLGTEIRILLLDLIFNTCL
jgi:hypothetical protein